MITLDELLASRDARHALQQQLLAEHPGHTLVCTTVVVPGSVKRNQHSLIVAHAAVEALRKAFGVDQWTERDRRQRFIERDLPTGYEVYLVTPTPLLEAKLMAVQIEDGHPLGRLFDIDVIDQQGAPVPRTAVGASRAVAWCATARRATACACDGTRKTTFGRPSTNASTHTSNQRFR